MAEKHPPQQGALYIDAMSDSYGVTFAQKFLQHGEYEQALTAAQQHAQREPDNPEPHHDLAKALTGLTRYAEAVAAYQEALRIDKEAQILSDWEIDDGLFSLTVAWAQTEKDQAEQLRILRLYATTIPGGRHLKEAEEWALRVRGLLKTTFVKPRD